MCAEIVDFCEFLSPTPEEKAKRDAAIESVFEVIKHIWPHCQVWLSSCNYCISSVVYGELWKIQMCNSDVGRCS